MGFVDQVRVVRRALDVDTFGSVVAAWWVSAGITGHALLLLLSTAFFVELHSTGWQVADISLKSAWLALHMLSLFSLPVAVKARCDFFLLLTCTLAACSWLVIERVSAIQEATDTLEPINMAFNSFLGLALVLILVSLSPLSLLLLIALVLVRLSSELSGSHSAGYYVLVVVQFLVDAACYVCLSFSFSVIPALAWRIHHDARRSSGSNLSYSL